MAKRRKGSEKSGGSPVAHFVGAYSYFNPRKERKWAFLDCDEHGQGGMSGGLSLDHVLERFSKRKIKLTDEEKDYLNAGKGVGRKL
jgi:hypothetical protein